MGLSPIGGDESSLRRQQVRTETRQWSTRLVISHMYDQMNTILVISHKYDQMTQGN